MEYGGLIDYLARRVQMDYLYDSHLPPCGVATTHAIATVRGAVAYSNKYDQPTFVAHVGL